MSGAGCWRCRMSARSKNCAVQGLVADESQFGHSGVRVKIDNGAEEIIAGGSRGRRQRARIAEPGLARSFGYARPEEERIEIGIGYTTRVYRRRPTDLGGKLAIVVAGSEPNWRNGVILYQSEDRWIVSVGGYFGDHAPDDDQMFAAYAGSLPTPEIHDIVAHAEPLTRFRQLSLSRQSAAALRTAGAISEKLSGVRRRPMQLQSGLRPGHDGGGAGSRAAARCLRDGDADLAPRFFKRGESGHRYALGYRRRQRPAASPSEGPRSAKVRFINWYIGKLHMAARRDAVLAKAFLKVANLTMPPAGLLHPSAVMRVIYGNIRWRSGANAQGSLESAG